jgi:hypothetical protein
MYCSSKLGSSCPIDRPDKLSELTNQQTVRSSQFGSLDNPPEIASKRKTEFKLELVDNFLVYSKSPQSADRVSRGKL